MVNTFVRFVQQPETYASIHKGSRGQPNVGTTQRRGSKDDGVQNNGFAAQPSAYGSTYTGYRPQVNDFQMLFLDIPQPPIHICFLTFLILCRSRP